jgi:hypothetical protein
VRVGHGKDGLDVAAINAHEHLGHLGRHMRQRAGGAGLARHQRGGVQRLVGKQIVRNHRFARHAQRGQQQRGADAGAILARRAVEGQRRVARQQFGKHAAILAVELGQNARIAGRKAGAGLVGGPFAGRAFGISALVELIIVNSTRGAPRPGSPGQATGSAARSRLSRRSHTTRMPRFSSVA